MSLQRFLLLHVGTGEKEEYRLMIPVADCVQSADLPLGEVLRSLAQRQ